MKLVREERGQATVELAFILLLLLALLMGVIEFGEALSHNLTLNAASREGARIAGSLTNGGGTLGCGVGQSPNAATVDPQIIATVNRILTGNGSLVALADVQQIRIYKADANGGETSGAVNVWTYTPGAGPLVDGEALDFSLSGSVGWPACQRNNVSPADSAGIAIVYTYRAKTPLGKVLPPFSTIAMSDRTVMSLNAAR